MEIAASTLSLSSTQTKTQFYQRKESLLITGPGPVSDQAPAQAASETPVSEKSGADLVSLSKEARRSRQTEKSKASGECRDTLMKDLNIRILKDLVERATGKKIEMRDIARAYRNGGQKVSEQPAKAPDSAGWGMDYEVSEVYAETETTSFDARGQVVTADGRKIDVSLSLSMSREFVQREHLHIQAGDAPVKDPLVVNFDGTAAELSQTRFEFDIDCDGKADQISSLAPGSGFLAVDKNRDNIINDGSELFGPATGHGFSELAAYDEDGNHWIDESDAIYDKLRVWTKTASGDSRLFALGEKGIGAISLDHLASAFDIKDSQNQLLGQVREAGIFLDENGGAGTIQELDFVV